MNIHTYGYVYVHEYHLQTLYQLLDMNIRWCVRYSGYSDVFFSEFACHFECFLFDQPYCNQHSAQIDTQMIYIWTSHETERIHGPFCHL